MRRFLTALVVAGALLPVPARASVPILVIDGRGFGHGVGMAQDGAFWMGKAGATTEKILGQFYPGTTMGRSRGLVRVPVLDAGPAPTSAMLAFPNGGEVRDAPAGPQSRGFPVRVPAGGQVRVVWDRGRYRVEQPGGRVALGRPQLASSRRSPSPVAAQAPPLDPPSPPTTSPGPTTPAPPSPPEEEPPPPAGDEAPPPDDPSAPDGGPPTSARTLWAVPAEGGTIALPARQRRYRGVVEATAGSGTLRLVNQLDLEQYLKAMGEVLDPNWPPASLRAQAVAARTYAMRAMAAAGEICETQRCQVYLGAQAEYGAMNKAVEATNSQVLLFNKGLASTVYSANGGGFSASREEGFGVLGTDLPYLRPAPYPTKDPVPWNVTIALRDVRARFGYPGNLTDVRIGRTGPSGRALEVILDGSAGPKPVAGIAFDAGLGLRSTLFTLRTDTGEAPPPPAPDEGFAHQAPPDQAGGEPVPPVDQPPSEAANGALEPTHTTQPAGDGGPRSEASILAGWSLLALGGAGALLRRHRRPGAGRDVGPPQGDGPTLEAGEKGTA